MKFDLSLYLVTDRNLTAGRPLAEIVEAAVKGGATMVQLREKDCSTADFLNEAFQIKEVLRPFRVPLIINDRVDIALAVCAEGVHLGQSDMPVEVARRLMGEDAVIGLSVENAAQAHAAVKMIGLDYIGLSPVFNTDTKKDTAPALGLDGIRQISSICKLPSVAIGGINESNCVDIIQAGADGIAVVSAIGMAADVQRASRNLLYKINKVMKQRSRNL